MKVSQCSGAGGPGGCLGRHGGRRGALSRFGDLQGHDTVSLVNYS